MAKLWTFGVSMGLIAAGPLVLGGDRQWRLIPEAENASLLDAVKVFTDAAGLRVRAPNEMEAHIVDELTAPRPGEGGGGELGALTTIQHLYESPPPELGPPSSEGNGVLLAWVDPGQGGEWVVFVDGEEQCRLPGLLLPGASSCVVTGLTATCRDAVEGDPNCPANLTPACDPDQFFCDLSSGFCPPFNVHTFEVRHSTAGALIQCQEVFQTWPFANRMVFCARSSLADSSCDAARVQIGLPERDCNTDIVETDCDIIITGGSSGPPASSLAIYVDGKLALQEPYDSFFCFEKSVHAATRGLQEVTAVGLLTRQDAADIDWFDPVNQRSVSKIVGAFRGLEVGVVASTTTACGAPKPPTDLILRQTAFSSSGQNAVRASWRNGEDPYPQGVKLLLDGQSFGPVLPGGARTAVLGGLAAGVRRVGVQGNETTPPGPSSLTDGTLACLSQSPFANGAPVELACTLSPSDGGAVTATWTSADPVDWIDVELKLAGSERYEFIDSALGGNGSITHAPASDAGVVRLTFFRRSQGALYASRTEECSYEALAGRVLPGDTDGDAALDISDAIRLLFHLFLGQAGVLPCPGPDPAVGRQLLDWNGDGALDITDVIAELQHLFVGGPSHALGSECIALAGCSDACGN